MLLAVLSGISSRISYYVVANRSGLFAADYIAALDGVTVIPGGWLNHNWIQLAHQLADCVTGFSYSFGMTCIILFVMNLIPGLSLRVSDDAEIQGIDEAELGEFAYDFVEKERDYIHGPELIDGAVNLNLNGHDPYAKGAKNA
jgi:ammonium transporter, Amt family